MEADTTRAVLTIPPPRADRATGTLKVEVEVLETRNRFGRTDCLVTPACGSGEQWVSDKRLEVTG